MLYKRLIENDKNKSEKTGIDSISKICVINHISL